MRQPTRGMCSEHIKNAEKPTNKTHTHTHTRLKTMGRKVGRAPQKRGTQIDNKHKKALAYELVRKCTQSHVDKHSPLVLGADTKQ